MRLLPLLLPLLWFGPRPTPQPDRLLAIKVDPDVAVRIHNLVGTTRVTGWDRDSIVVVGRIPPRSGRFFGGGGGRGAKLGVEGQDPSLTGPGSDLDVRVPRGARISIKSASADVEVTDLGGEVETSCVTGSIRVSGAPRVATLESIDGDITMTGAATVIRARTGAGAVRITGARGDLAVTTVQGPITIDTDQLLSARVESVSGRVEIRSGVLLDGLLDVSTHDADVQLFLPDPIDARFDLSTVKGAIVTGLPGHRGPAAERTARFSVGKKAGAGRGAGITIRTFSGGIQVHSNPKGG